MKKYRSLILIITVILVMTFGTLAPASAGITFLDDSIKFHNLLGYSNDYNASKTDYSYYQYEFTQLYLSFTIQDYYINDEITTKDTFVEQINLNGITFKPENVSALQLSGNNTITQTDIENKLIYLGYKTTTNIYFTDEPQVVKLRPIKDPYQDTFASCLKGFDSFFAQTQVESYRNEFRRRAFDKHDLYIMFYSPDDSAKPSYKVLAKADNNKFVNDNLQYFVDNYGAAGLRPMDDTSDVEDPYLTLMPAPPGYPYPEESETPTPNPNEPENPTPNPENPTPNPEPENPTPDKPLNPIEKIIVVIALLPFIVVMIAIFLSVSGLTIFVSKKIKNKKQKKEQKK